MIDLGEIAGGFITVFQPSMFLFLLIGFLIGTFFGAVPGITATVAIALLLPMTYGMHVVPALIMCMGIFMAGIYAGSITATTINIPGAPSAMMTAIEGFPMMQRGEGAKALGHAAFSSTIGGTIGAGMTLFLVLVATPLILFVRTPDKFCLLVFALVVVTIIQRKSIAKGTIATVIGLMIGTIGVDPTEPVGRFDFGITGLMAGIDLLVMCIGLFAISEVLIQTETHWKEIAQGVKLRRKEFIPKFRDLKEIGIRTYFKSTIIGYLIGVLPGAGGSVAAFVSYAEAMRSSKHREEYGKGKLEGIAAAETANNAMCGGALMPMLIFGIPGDATSAMIMGVILIHGLVPGPKLIENQFHLIAPMLAALTVCAALLIIPSLMLLGPYYVRAVQINRAILYSFIAMVALVGAYVATYDIFQMGMALLAGVVAYFLRKHDYPIVPLLLGFILGPMAEEYLRRSLVLSGGSLLIFVTRPASISFLVLTVVFVYFLVIRPHLQERKRLREQGNTDSNIDDKPTF